MTTATTTLHTKVQRNRLAQHAYAALTSWLPATLRAASPVRPTSAEREAAAVREMAYAYSKTDPSFADDLYAAANRHEALHGRK